MYYCNVGDCLFDLISYSLQYKKTLIMLRLNFMSHVNNCLANNTPKAYKKLLMKLNVDFLNDLYHGQVLDENQYIEKCLLFSAANRGV